MQGRLQPAELGVINIIPLRDIVLNFDGIDTPYTIRNVFHHCYEYTNATLLLDEDTDITEEFILANQTIDGAEILYALGGTLTNIVTLNGTSVLPMQILIVFHSPGYLVDRGIKYLAHAVTNRGEVLGNLQNVDCTVVFSV